ncbi:MAG: hypothetical protein ABIP55_05265 [Tepidisphaeraceae bacterium]
MVAPVFNSQSGRPVDPQRHSQFDPQQHLQPDPQFAPQSADGSAHGGDPPPRSQADPQRKPTARQFRANRRNASKSTGPRTPEGKKRSSGNAITHGLFCGHVVLPGEDARLFLRLRNDFIRRLRPQDLLELSLVDRIAAAQWKLDRVQAADARLHLFCGGELLRQVRRRLGEFKTRHNVEKPTDLLRKGIDNIDTINTNDDPLALYQEYVDLSCLAAQHEVDGVTALLCITRGNRIDPDEAENARGRNDAAFDRLSRYARHLQSEISRCLRDLTRLRQMDAQSRDLPDSPFEESLSPEDNAENDPPPDSPPSETTDPTAPDPTALDAKCENEPISSESDASTAAANSCNDHAHNLPCGDAPGCDNTAVRDEAQPRPGDQ